MSLNSSITSQAPVKYNAQRDVGEHTRRKKQKLHGDAYRGFTAGGDHELSIMPRDLCLRKRVKHSYKRMYTDTDINVFSSANQMAASCEICKTLIDAKDFEGARRKLRQDYDFGGIAVTGSACDPNAAAGSNKEMVVLFGGTFTIRNTGSKPIYSGQWVMWDLPSLDPGNKRRWKSDQVPHHKLVFETVPFDSVDKYELGSRDAREELREAAAALGGADEANPKAFSKAVRAFDEVSSDARRRVFGRALSNAEPGKEFDIVLGRYMA